MQYQDQPGAGSPVQPNFQQPQPPQQGGYYQPQPGVQQPAQPGYGYGQPGAAPVAPVAHPQMQQPVQPAGRDSQKLPDRKSVASKLIELCYLILIIVESLLALRFVFKLLGGNQDNVFLQFLYSITYPMVYPFKSIFVTGVQNQINVLQSSLEFYTLVTMGIYALIAYIVVRIIDVFR